MELLEIPSKDDCQDFACEVHASFAVPKAHNWANEVDNDYTPTSPSIHWEILL